MELTPTEIEGLLIVEPRVFGDERGFFLESWNRHTFAQLGLDLDFVQDNHSRSARGVLRGLHYQQPNPQGKLVRVVAGRAWDVAVDLRAGSPTYGRWVGVELSAENKRMFWVPPGFAHGFVSLEDGTDFLYKCTAFYDPANEHSLMWNDPTVGIEWPLDGIEPQLSAKDKVGRPLQDVEAFA
ncbi:dTDP-4-dehydrorhamnose 3,5-epimerase [Novosphingobium album (ex Liu et al. 2023)]|uniref:dTDP-4-dehydrorhamnose 3,5-epimerase n=1 Tax=Novosphingobium album (ex Liu et al. 2023) TaxID=3031130 RepID=A0ABT5WQG9_9SPHN|nr:dTDP-4-dehydrorhamnose 3,5-epimerase [Novosphingobium album (ex Liu et al. 2023)]MDE8652284.1 dTDP-4-dehydrorhamnose 3,5-epimerase [Novosphingobium album (ex Liu et al. 2023)]